MLRSKKMEKMRAGALRGIAPDRCMGSLVRFMRGLERSVGGLVNDSRGLGGLAKK